METPMEQETDADRGLLQALLGDGRPLLLFCGLSLVLAGGFALFLSASKHFLPHDVQYLGMTAEQLCGVKNCRVVYFMFHDRVAFGGALIVSPCACHHRSIHVHRRSNFMLEAAREDTIVKNVRTLKSLRNADNCKSFALPSGKG